MMRSRSTLVACVVALAAVVGLLLIPERVAQAAASIQQVMLNGGTVATPVPIGTGSTTSTDPHYGALKTIGPGAPFTLQASVTKAASFSGTTKTGLGGFVDLVVTWDVTVAERDSANETYDLYVTAGDGVSSWDIAHFPQIVTTGAKRYTAIVSGRVTGQEVTTATPGVSAVASSTFKTDTAGAGEGIKTLAAGKVRHGNWGDRIGYELVIAGTVATGITYSVTATPK